MLQTQAAALVKTEPLMQSLTARYVESYDTLGALLSRLLADKFGCSDVGCDVFHQTFVTLYRQQPALADLAARDLCAILRDDPAAQNHLSSLFFFKGYQALQGYRLAHALWIANRQPLALFIQSRMSEVYAIDIHPAAQIGAGITLDHATGIVIGETAIIGDDVLMLHNVTLGTREFTKGDRHPVVGSRVVIGAGAKILGRITIGDDATVAAGSLVIEPVPAGATVAGVPARILREAPKT